MAHLQALIFDVDGTLAETERDGHRVAFNRAFEEAGLDWRWDVERYGALLAVTGGKERMAADLAQRDAQFAATPAARELIGRLHRRKNEIYGEIVASRAIELRAGVERLLREAHDAGLRLAIATTTSPENLDALLRACLGADAGSWFEVIGAGDVVAHKKPAPDIYHWVLGRLRLSSRACLAFEDSAAGLRSARAAGLRTVVTIGQYTGGQSFDGALAVLDGLGDADAPARGHVLGQAWRGMVDVPTLRGWAEVARHDRGFAPAHLG